MKKKIAQFFCFLILFVVISLNLTPSTFAAEYPSCNEAKFNIKNLSINPSSVHQDTEVRVTFDKNSLPDSGYLLEWAGFRKAYRAETENVPAGKVLFIIPASDLSSTEFKPTLILHWGHDGNSWPSDKACTAGQIKIASDSYDSECVFNISEQRDGKQCYGGNGGCLEGGNVKIQVRGLMYNGKPYNGLTHFKLGALGAGEGVIVDFFSLPKATNGQAEVTVARLDEGDYDVQIYTSSIAGKAFVGCKTKWTVKDEGECKNQCITTPIDIGGTSKSEPYNLCAQVKGAGRDKCDSCLESEGLWTAVGCIPTAPESIIKVVVKIGLSVAGGVALLMIVASSFSLSTSQGDPKKVNDAKDQLSAAIIGLVFIIFSISILQFIGVSIFAIPGFGG